jgi:hypothetical protein
MIARDLLNVGPIFWDNGLAGLFKKTRRVRFNTSSQNFQTRKRK